MSGPTIDATGFHLAVNGGLTGLNGWIEYFRAGHVGIYGTAADTSPDSPDGQWIGFLAASANDLEQALLNVYNGRSPAGAVGAGLARLVALNGIARKTAQYSTVPILLSGTPGTIVPAASFITSASDPTLPSFETLANYTIGGGGTVVGSGICSVPGPVQVASGDLTVIGSPVTGWDTVTNTDVAAPGLDVETDPDLRARRTVSVAMPSQSLLDGLYGALLSIPGVTDAAVYENPTAAPDLSGRSIPPHSIHAIVEGGASADIANAIWTKASMGCTKVGAVAYTLTDAQGNPQTMQWDTPGTVNVYVTVKLAVVTPNPFVVAAIQQAIWDYGTQRSVSKIGKNVSWFELATPINALDLTGEPGQASVTNLYLGSAPTPTDQADLIIPYNARPFFGASPTSGQIQVVGL
jgi:uncharacterized phage protein gp47/JayE